jgi:hypothetical protein
MSAKNHWTAAQTIAIGIPITAQARRRSSPTGTADISPTLQRWVGGPLDVSPEETSERRPVQSSLRDSTTTVSYPNAEALYLFSVSETTGGRDSALRCPSAVQARKGWGKVNRSLVPPLDAAGTAQRAVPTTVNTYEALGYYQMSLRDNGGVCVAKRTVQGFCRYQRTSQDNCVQLSRPSF